MERFEWDPAKSDENLRKHGISFEQAREIWDGDYVDIPHVAYAKDHEARNATIGVVGGRIHVAVWVSRASKIRLISVRRVRKNEKRAYEKVVQERR